MPCTQIKSTGYARSLIYEATKLQIELATQLKNARIKKKMTQEEVATILHTQKPAISWLETCHENVKSFPSL